jgi:ferredoxin
MFFHSRSKNRPYHLGNFPLETLPRDDAIIAREAGLPRASRPKHAASKTLFGIAVRRYHDLFAELSDGDPAPAKAPVPDDLERRMIDIKGSAYFMNADQAGICKIPDNAWLKGTKRLSHDHAVVIAVEYGRLPEADNPAHGWVDGEVGGAARMRAVEIATLIARQIRVMGFNARVDIAGEERLDADRLAVLAGLAVRSGDRLVNPYLGEDFTVAVVSTDYGLACDRPLAEAALDAQGLRYWWGRNGARSGRERNRRAKRPTHMGIYPMEQVRRVERPTTLIIDEEVPRVPKRAAFFERAVRGDLGEKTRQQRIRFSTKQPTSAAMQAIIACMVPYQDGTVAKTDTAAYQDAEANTKAIKSLSYFLGADMTGICEIPRYAWNSHEVDGTPITTGHKYAVVMLIDQEFDTMEGASGDDWISGAQSMRAYLRGAEISGIMAELVRGLGFPSRTHTQMNGQVEHIPLLLWAGLGELSRIGELILNPFMGPRLKSVVFTTDMPLKPDKPVDFGLQYFCNNCWKCARECPCDAIPWGDKIMFNGYEIWKPDVERCARYRLTNSKGSACGRCMKTCPLNKVVDADGPLMTRIASYIGIHHFWLKPLVVPFAVWFDDFIGNGKRNLVKKWWFDLEVVDGVAVEPKGANTRDIDPSHSIDPAKQKMAIYNADQMPPPDHIEPFPVDRKAALAAVSVLETPAQARARQLRGGRVPVHYVPTKPLGTGKSGKQPVKQWYEAVKT